MTDRQCLVDGCDGKVFCRGWCNSHYNRWYRHGNLDQGTPISRRSHIRGSFWSKVNKDGSVPTFAPHLGQCWIWTAGLTSGGYGKYTTVPGYHTAHRFAFESTKGKIASGLFLDHLCRVTLCVNPDHLEAVTPKENVLRGFSPAAMHARKGECPRGHIYDSACRKGNRTHRYCSICRHESYVAKRLTPLREGL